MFSDDQHLRGDELLHMAAGSLFSAVLRLAIELDVFVKLKGASVPVVSLGDVWGMPASSARVLAQCLVHIGVLTYADGRLSNAPLADTYLAGDTWTGRRAHYFSRGAGFDLDPHALKRRFLDPPVHLWYQIKDGTIDGSEETWWKHGHENRMRWGERLAGQYDFTRHRLLLDVGGATGGWCIGVRTRFPHLRCVLFEIPAAARLAREMIAEAGNTEAISVVEGSFLTDPLPEADVVLLANILHDWTPSLGREILDHAYASLSAGGVVLIKEYFLEDDWTAATESILQAMWVIGPEGKSGWQPTYSEMEAALAETGFVGIERGDFLVQGRKP